MVSPEVPADLARTSCHPTKEPRADDPPIPRRRHRGALMETPEAPRLDDDAVAHIPAIAIPFSNLASPEEKQNRIRHNHAPKLTPGPDIVEVRRLVDELWMIPHLARMRETFDVTIEER